MPAILEGYCQVQFYEYSHTFESAITEALEWIKAHPEYEVEDVLVGSDEGTWVTLYCRNKGVDGT